MQETTLYSISIPPMTKALEALRSVLSKAKAHAGTKATVWLPAEKHEAALLNDRLVFDQFNLIKQVQVATDNAKGAAARLAQIEIPVYEDTESTFDELDARLSKTIEFLKSIQPEQLIGKESISVRLPYFKDQYFTGFDYVTGYLIPNFFFHVTTAYSIVRKNGVPVGKDDFIGGLPLKPL